MRRLRSAGADHNTDYMSFQVIVANHEWLVALHALFRRTPNADWARLDVPRRVSGFRRSHASHLLRVVSNGNYREQELICKAFLALLAVRRPYTVTLKTAGAELNVRDTRPWFKMAGRLRSRDTRSFPDGEIAYAEERINGEFVVDGALLPVPQHDRFAAEAKRLMPLSREMSRTPLRLTIRRGRVTAVDGKGRAPAALERLFEQNPRYRKVTEVGISFNRAVKQFIHSWPAASNEVRPGVHIGIGGEGSSDDDEETPAPLVHIDCITANCEVWVNDQPFLQASS